MGDVVFGDSSDGHGLTKSASHEIALSFARSFLIVVLFSQAALTHGRHLGSDVQGKGAPSPRTSESYRN